MKNLFLSLLLLAFSVTAVAIPSAKREVHETADMARSRYLLLESQEILDIKPMGRSAWDVATHLENLNFNQVADVGSIERLNQIFAYIRDTKFMTNLTGQPLTERRLSWMYPDDGCYIRAELAAVFSSRDKLPETYKLFSFGDLAVKTTNHPQGIVRWWYHVVPVYRVGAQAYAMDPSIDPRAPMTVQEWKKAQEADRPVDKFAVCKPRAVGPEGDCQNPYGQAVENSMAEQKRFLNQEWERVLEMGRNPELELGNNPPW